MNIYLTKNDLKHIRIALTTHEADYLTKPSDNLVRKLKKLSKELE